MKKLMKKKISLFGKEFSVFAIAVVAMMTFAAAALVPYISNTITGTMDVGSPMKIDLFADGCTGDVCTFSILGGQIIEIEDTVTKLIAEDTGDMLIEVKVADFDGEGVELDWYYQSAGSAIPFEKVVSGDHTYYYLGETAPGFNWDGLPKDFSESGLIKVKTALALDPTVTYSFSARVIIADNKVA